MIDCRDKKKKVLFCMQTMVMGGVEKELITILSKFDKKEYDVTVLVFYIQDESVINRIPSWVRVLNLGIDKEYYCSSLPILVKKRLIKGKIYEAIKLIVAKLIRFGQSGTVLNMSGIPAPSDSYDIAVCYHIFSPIMFKYVATRIVAKKKIAWVHNDFKTTGYRIDKMLKYLNKYQEVVSVSKRVNEEFLELCPSYKGMTSVAYNILDEEEVRERANEIIYDKYFQDKTFKILTIGRFSAQKGIDIAINAMKLVKENKCLGGGTNFTGI